MTHNRKPTPRYDSIGEREDFQLMLFAFVMFAILAISVATCIVHDIRTMQAIDAILARTAW